MKADKHRKVEKAEKKTPARRTGLWVLLAGVTCEGLGFMLLAKGSMTLAPALLVGSFLVMGIGIALGWD